MDPRSYLLVGAMVAVAEGCAASGDPTSDAGPTEGNTASHTSSSGDLDGSSTGRLADSTSDDAGTTGTSSAGTSTSSAGGAETTAGVACGCDAFDVEACDQYVAESCRCVDEAMLGAEAEASVIDALAQTCDAWSGQDPGTLIPLCTAAYASLSETCDVAPLFASCAGSCDSEDQIRDGVGGCYCDPTCERHGDCCADYETHCGRR